MGETPYDPMSVGSHPSDRPDVEEDRPETRQIREEIVQTREDLGETLETLEERLRPSHLAEQARQAVKDAGADKVEDLKSQANRAATHVADWTRDTTSTVIAYIREHPVPAAWAGGAGLAMLLAAGRWSNRGADRRSSPRADEWARGEEWHPEPNVSTRHEVPAAHRVARRHEEPLGRDGGTLYTMLQRNPVAFGTGAFMAGVIVGLVLQESEIASDYVEAVRDTVREKTGAGESTPSHVSAPGPVW